MTSSSAWHCCHNSNHKVTLKVMVALVSLWMGCAAFACLPFVKRQPAELYTVLRAQVASASATPDIPVLGPGRLGAIQGLSGGLAAPARDTTSHQAFGLRRASSLRLLPLGPLEVFDPPAASALLAQIGDTAGALSQIAVLAGAGFLLRRLDIINEEITRGLSRVTLTVLLPSLLLTRLASLQVADVERASGLLLGVFLLIAGGFAVGEALSRLLKLPKRYARSFTIGCAFGNSASVPIIMLSSIISSYASLQGSYTESEALGLLAIAMPVQHVLMWLLGYNYVRGKLFPEDSGRSPRTSFLPFQQGLTSPDGATDNGGIFADSFPREPEPTPQWAAAPLFLRYQSSAPQLNWGQAGAGLRDLINPPLVAIALGLAVVFVPLLHDLWSQPTGALHFLVSPLTTLAGAVVPVGLMTLGSNLSDGPRESADIKPVAAMFAARQFLAPLLGVLLCIAFKHAGLFAQDDALPPLVLMLMASAPTANNVVNVATACGAGPAEVSTSVSWQYVGFLVLQLVYLPIFVAVAQTPW
eukprot:EG_transcript_6465